MKSIDFCNITSIQAFGFVGFLSIKELFLDYSCIPSIKGVYLIIRPNSNRPSFRKTGTGGYFKGKNPNVPISELEQNWINDTMVMYIGKAGGINSRATLQSRLKQYLKFGQGYNVGHWGGRFIWQLQDAKDLIVCWKPLYEDNPREVKKALIQEFKIQNNGQRPFANLQD